MEFSIGTSHAVAWAHQQQSVGCDSPCHRSCSVRHPDCGGQTAIAYSLSEPYPIHSIIDLAPERSPRLL